MFDGDSFLAIVDGGEEEVRLIGINAPERGECLADDARQALVELAADGVTGRPTVRTGTSTAGCCGMPTVAM